MADKNKKGGSKAGTLLLLVLLLLVGVGIAGYLKPDLPVVGPLVSKFFKKGAEGIEKNGVYQVRVKQVAVSHEEFSEGENVDLQVTIEHIGVDDKRITLWESKQYGARKAKVGRDSVTANWEDRPVDFPWRSGEKFIVKVWDRAGLTDTLLYEYMTDPTSKAFPLTGSHTFDKVKGKTPRVAGANQIVFEASRTGDLTE